MTYWTGWTGKDRHGRRVLVCNAEPWRGKAGAAGVEVIGLERSGVAWNAEAGEALCGAVSSAKAYRGRDWNGRQR